MDFGNTSRRYRVGNVGAAFRRPDVTALYSRRYFQTFGKYELARSDSREEKIAEKEELTEMFSRGLLHGLGVRTIIVYYFINTDESDKRERHAFPQMLMQNNSRGISARRKGERERDRIF